MPGQIASPPAQDGRVSTGNPALDTMLEGGLVARRPYLVVGPSGTGKSTLALQFLCEGVRQGEKSLLVTVEEPPNETRLNHRGLEPDLDQVDVFDAIPDIMRYERTPFKDIAAVRHAEPFSGVPTSIRLSPELSAVEVTMTGLEQMLRTEVVRRGYTRIAIDSLTALQYFCMKGFEPVAGAQAFLRFLSDLRITTLLTLESPLEDVESPERMLARGEIRLFRWELEGRSVRAIGVEKFRGSPHDVRLHPYRIGPRGLDINLELTISRDTRQILEVSRPEEAVVSALAPAAVVEEFSPLDPLVDQVRDLVTVGAEVGPLRAELNGAFTASATGELDRARVHLARVTSLVVGLADTVRERPTPGAPSGDPVAEAYLRIVARSESARAGVAPTELPPGSLLGEQLATVLSLLPVEGATVDEAPSQPTPNASAGPPRPATLDTEETVAAETADGPPATEAPSGPLPPAPDATAQPPAVLPMEGGATADEESPRVERVVGSPLEPPAAPPPPPPVPVTSRVSIERSSTDRELRSHLPAGPRPLRPMGRDAGPARVDPGERLLPPLPGPRSTRPSLAAPPPPAPPAPPVGPAPTRPTEDSAGALRETRPPLPMVGGPEPPGGSTEAAATAGSAAAVAGLGAGGEPSPPEGTPSTPSTTPTKRRRRTSESSRRRTSSRARSSSASSLTPGDVLDGALASSGTTAGTGVASTKPRRRTGRKRKAPTVLAATAGSAPTDGEGDPAAKAPHARATEEPDSQPEAG